MMDFQCEMCQEFYTFKWLAFTFEVDGIPYGVCGDCAESN